MTAQAEPVAVVLFDADGVIQTFESGWSARTASLSGSQDSGEDFLTELFVEEQPTLRGEGDFPAAIARVLQRWSSPHTVGEVLERFRASKSSRKLLTSYVASVLRAWPATSL